MAAARASAAIANPAAAPVVCTLKPAAFCHPLRGEGLIWKIARLADQQRTATRVPRARA